MVKCNLIEFVTVVTIMLMLLAQTGDAQFQCSSEEVSGPCNPELHCIYNEDYVDPLGYPRCRCKIIIDVIPLADNILTFNMFRNICYENEHKLQQLWILDAELEHIDNKIFEIYGNLEYLNLAGNSIRLNFTSQAKRLSHLDVSNNGLNSVQSDALNSLTSLRMINMSFNRLDSINFCFKELKLLEEVYLNNNHLIKIEKEFDHLNKLRILDLAHNFLTTIDSEFYFRNLQELYLNNNILVEINKSGFVHLPNLKKLHIEDNSFKAIEGHHKFSNLQELHCDNNQIRRVDANILNSLSNLRYFNLSNNQMMSMDSNMFAHSNQLVVVDVSSNKISKIDPANFQKFQNLLFLNLNNNSITEEVIKCDNMKNLGQILTLHLSFNQIKKIYDCSFDNLKNLTKLTLESNKLEKIPPRAFTSLAKLRELNLAENRITDIPDGTFDNLGELRKLNISNNQLTKFNLNSLNYNPKITEFDVRSNNMQDFDLKLLKNILPSLEVLDVDANIIKCDIYTDVLKYFDDHSVVLKSCPTVEECCDSGLSKKMAIVIAVGTVVCALAFVGIGTILFNICSSKKYNAVHLVPVSQHIN